MGSEILDFIGCWDLAFVTNVQAFTFKGIIYVSEALFVRREDLKIFVRLYKVRPMTAKNILFDSEMCGT